MGKWRGPPHAEIPRCGATTRAGHPCGRYAMPNGRCRLHGGLSSGAKRPYRPLKHGMRTAQAEAERRFIASLIRDARKLIESIGASA